MNVTQKYKNIKAQKKKVIHIIAFQPKTNPIKVIHHSANKHNGLKISIGQPFLAISKHS